MSTPDPHADFRMAGYDTTKVVTPPWPIKYAPIPQPLKPAPSESDSLERFKGYDAVVVTWTSAEADTLATLFTPEYPLSSWYEYRHDVESYIPLVTGEKAPFNDDSREMKCYYRSLGLYMPCRIGDARVLCFKSGLHLAYDGPRTPVRRLMAEIAETVHPKLFVTTGTAGGVGSGVQLGDVIFAGKVRFDCRQQFRGEPWAHASYEASQMPPGTTKLVTAQLTQPNTSRIPGARKIPKIWSGVSSACVTTDFFCFDCSSDYYKIQGLGRCCDMGDAAVFQALEKFRDMRVYSIRNASDPQIADRNGNIQEASRQAESIYSQYGALTTAASAVTTWAAIVAASAKW